MKKFLAYVLVLGMMLSTTSALNVSAAEETRENIAIGATVKLRDYNNSKDLSANGADEEGNGGKVGSNAVDGDDNTIAMPSERYDTAVWIDLGAVYNVSDVEVLYSQRAEEYEVLFSKAGSGDWLYAVDLAGQEKVLGDVTLNVSVFPREARYIMVRSNGTIGQGIREIKVYESKTNLIDNADISLTYRDGSPISESNTGKLKDKNFTTACGPYAFGTPVTDYSWNAVIALDNEYVVDEVGFVVNTCRGTNNFAIETSTDGVTYTSAGTVTIVAATTSYTNGNRYHNLKFFPTKARFIRIVDASAAHNYYGVVISEMAVFESLEKITNLKGNITEVTLSYKDGSVATANNGGVAALYDGNLATCCGVTGNAANDPSNPYAWDVTIAFDNVYEIDNVKVVYNLCKVAGGVFDIETSIDGVNFVKRGSYTTDGTATTANTTGAYTYSVDFEPTVAQYVRVKDSSNAHPQTGYVISEIVVNKAESTKNFYSDNIKYTSGGETIDKLKKGSITSEITVYAKDKQDVVIISGLFDRFTNQMINVNKSKQYTLESEVETVSVTLDVTEEIPERVNLVTPDCTAALRNHSNTADQNANMSVDGEGGYMASYICDGNPATYAMGSGEYTGAIVLGFDEAKTVGQIDVLFERYTPDYDVLVSADGEEYNLVKNVTGDVGSGLVSFMVPSQEVKYVMVRNNSTTKTQAIYEMYVYEPVSRYELRTFLWDSVEGMKPLSDVNVLGN